MSVLDVVHRVFIALAFGQIEVEIQVLIGFAQGVEETAGIIAHFAAQFAQGDKFARAGGHRCLLAVAVEHRELHQGHLQLVGGQVECLDGAGDAGNVAVVVGAPDIDDLVETTLEFVEMVGDVGGEIGVQAVFPLYDAVFFIAESGGTEPFGTILHVDVPFFFQQRDATCDQAGVVKGFLGEPDFEFDAEFLQIAAAIFQLLVECMLVHIVPVFAEERLGPGDQGVEMGLALGFRFVVRAVSSG